MKIINNENRKLVTELVTPVAPAYRSDIVCCSQILVTIICTLDFINKNKITTSNQCSLGEKS